MTRLNIAVTSGESAVVHNEPSRFSPTKMLYVLGAAIALIGIIIFVGQIWDQLGSFGHIAVTLGMGLILAIMGAVLLRQKPADKIGAVFHSLGGLLIPGGAVVLLNEMNLVTAWPLALTFGVIFLFYLMLCMVQKSAVLTFFAIANGTVFIYLIVQAILGGAFYQHGDVYAYLTMAIGVSYLLLAHAFRSGWNQPVVSALSFFGSVGFFGAAFTRVFDSTPWQMFYFLLVIGGLFLSAHLRSRSLLIVSTMFLIAHVSYITGEYFADSIGWPVALILLGFIFIGLGYVSITINKKYIKSVVA